MDIQYLYSFLLALGLSMLLIPLLIRHSARLHLVDDPAHSSRKLHSRAMPRSGGLGIILAASAALLVILPIDESLFSFLLGCLVIICFGLLDDVIELKPLQKLGGQALGVGIAMAGGMVVTDMPLLGGSPVWLCHLLTFVFVLGVINGVNFSDGMDGLAAGTTLMALLLIFILALGSDNTQVAAIALAISAALMGFLRFNTYPASIFMGDAGSQFLGFVVAWLAITVSQAETSPMTTLMPLLILGIPVMDILQVVPVRIKKKLPLPGPDKEHFHHQIARLGFYQYEVVAIIYVLQALLLGYAYVLRYASDAVVFEFFAGYVIFILGALYTANISGWRVRNWQAGDHHDRRNRLLRRISAVHPYSGKFFGLVIALILTTAAILASAMSASFIYASLLWAVVLLCIKLFSRNLWPLALGRLATYTVTILLMYGVTASVHSTLGSWFIDGGLLVLAALLFAAMRITRREYFWLTTQDLLVLFFIVILAPQMPFELGGDLSTGTLIFRTCILLYACEYVLARGEQARGRITTAAIIALFFIGVHL